MTKKDKNSSLEHFLSGGIAGAFEATVMYPTEFVKTQLQLQSGKSKVYKGPVDCAVKVVKERGFFGLYQGLSTLVIGTFAKASIRFYSYHTFTQLFSDSNGNTSRYTVLLAGLSAGMTEAVLAVTPAETIKTKLIHDRNQIVPKYKGLVHGVKTILKEEGFKGVYQGLIPTMLRQGANSAIRFSVYGYAQNIWKERGDPNKMATLKSFISGAAAGTTSTILTMPIDVVKTRLQGIDSKNYSGVIDCAIKIFKDEGIFTFWRGTIPRLSRVIFSSGIVFSVQDSILRLINSFK